MSPVRAQETEHAAHDPPISSGTVADVPLAGLSFFPNADGSCLGSKRPAVSPLVRTRSRQSLGAFRAFDRSQRAYQSMTTQGGGRGIARVRGDGLQLLLTRDRRRPS